MDNGLLTAKEQTLLTDLLNVQRQIGRIIEAGLGDAQEKNVDTARAEFHIGSLQQMIMSNAAARAYPAKYRLIGGRMPDPPRLP